MLVRILQPSLQKQIESSIKLTPELQPYILYFQGNLYLSLESVSVSQRETVYDVIQNYQIDESVSLQTVPASLRACLQSSRNRRGRFMGAVAIGAVLGIILGLMGMAVGVLVLSVIGLTDDVVGMAVTAVTFVACCAVGWFVATYYLWRVRPWLAWRN